MAEIGKHFTLDMTIAEAMQKHPRVREVFASFHLGGCAMCHVAQVETLDEVCESYSIDPDKLLGVLEELMEADPV
ncbi:MAG TPA: DUF1858 domain-containing protein [Candidatus Hydrogenedentes bacterium]|nr:DUF1858 domain-containing protein [Candidatus Hydrogenedentota bacterium]HPG69491.1 DUF1858 domain-containing protein [Candidatus Hydrogenedentota bacterium]